ncbi:MAG TPA: acetylornithine deacetylase [Gammaproteobacteria bacterium]|nr:acetylornithine deacetylase [Gammaproteobacteria bacterium]
MRKATPLDIATVLGELVSIPSVSSVSPEFDTPNRALVARIADYFDGLGWRCEIMELPGAPGKANLVASLGDGEGGLALAGHGDTVPWDEGAWSSDPFRLVERDGRLYGLGAADMKGFLALAIVLASRIERARLRRPLYIVVTADEESRMDGARLLVETGRPPASWCIVGEPTDLAPVRMHKGVLMEAVVVEGASGHSSDPDSAPNAIEGMARILAMLVAWRREMQGAQPTPDFAVPYPTLNLGAIHGGDNPNRICARAELHVDLRPLPGTELDSLRRELDERARSALEGSGCSYRRRSLFDGISGFETSRASRLVRLTEELSGIGARAVSFGTEAGFFSAMGMETLVLGPGSIEQAHKPDEFIETAALARAEILFGELIERLVLS